MARIVSALALLVVAMTTADALAAPALARLLPAEAAGFRGDGDDGHYDRDSLFDLIDGGAEVYRALNVRAVYSRRYVSAEGAEVLVDLFDMGSSSDAYGAYHHDMREGKSAGVGNESEQQGSSLFFWKGRYFVSVVALATDPSSRTAVRALAAAIARAIKDPGRPPALVGRLPHAGLVTSQVHYFHTWRLLGRHYNLGPDDLLGLDARTEGVLARYRWASARTAGQAEADAGALLLLVEFPGRKDAGRAEKRLRAALVPDADRRGVAHTAKRGWVAVRRSGALLCAVLEAPSAERALELIGQVAAGAAARPKEKP